jgi:hypothetical protein
VAIRCWKERQNLSMSIVSGGRPESRDVRSVRKTNRLMQL